MPDLIGEINACHETAVRLRRRLEEALRLAEDGGYDADTCGELEAARGNLSNAGHYLRRALDSAANSTHKAF